MSGAGEIAAPRTEKSPGAFRTISEVAANLDLPTHVLRFWELKFPQLKPVKRGGGRRYYRPEDIGLLRRIRQCLYQDGYTIHGVQKLLGSTPSDGSDNTARMVMPALSPFAAAAPDPPPAGSPPGSEPPALEQPTRRPRRRPGKPSAEDAERRATLEEIRRELVEARAALAELLGPRKSC